MSRPRLALAVAAVSGLLAAPVAFASEQIAVKATCATCHTATKKLVGPTWHDVAQKYKGKADAPRLLAERVRKGGKDTWGPVPMLPLGPDKISDADLKTVIAWILKTP